VIKLGISDQDSLMGPDGARRRGLLERAADAGLDHVTVGDHISFHGGTGFDGLVSASAVLTSQDRLSAIVGVYLLALRHPMATARSLSTLAQMAPGRLTLGVGVGGEDRHEIRNAGVDPATRGRRLDDALGVLRALSTGEEVTHQGEFFDLEAASVLPAPEPRVPIVIGGKGDVAVRRTARFGDGWLGMFCSARRFAETRECILAAAADGDRQPPTWFGVNVWCGLDPDEARAREILGAKMESLYRLPAEKFAHIAPAGSSARVAEWLADFVDAGAEHITLVPAASSIEAAIDTAAEIRERLQAHAGTSRECTPAEFTRRRGPCRTARGR
jgi:alkanesulfonate monooxygenase SsuD/methylene tetrahydromethanopterin reductase-like flavin-dependent oxidoreductase (luciferase family)